MNRSLPPIYPLGRSPRSPAHLPADWSLHDLYRNMEMPIVPLIDQMMANGMRIDRAWLGKLEEHYLEEMDKATHAAAAIIGVEPATLNLASPPQVADALYRVLKLKARKTTGSGKHGSTDEEELKRLQETTPAESAPGRFIYHLMEFRKFDKLEDSYCKKALTLADESDRIYTTLKQTRVVSGRLSSAEPFNLMAIPHDGDEAKLLRKGFVPRPGYSLLGLDYSQVEMRIMAHASHDPNMMRVFILDQDIHTETAALMFNIPSSQVDKDKHRYPAKRVGFGLFFGITDHGLLPHLPIENRNRAFAQGLIDRYFDVYRDVRSTIDEVQTHGRRYGWVADQFGRVRWVPEMASSIERIRAEGAREAFSHFIQGTAQGIIKIAMGDTLDLIRKYKLDCYPLIQIHDEMDFEIKQGQEREAAEIFGEAYANAVPIDVPVKVEVSAGENWGSMQPVLSVTSR